jgi:hypothetical protein
MSPDHDGGLEDLFGGGADEVIADEPAEAPAKPRSRTRRLLGNAALIIICTVVTVAGLRSRGISVSVLLVVAAFVALRLLLLAVSEVAPPPRPRRQARRAGHDGHLGPGVDTLRAAVRRWEQRLEWSQGDPDRFSRNVLPVLAELADERLRLKHGITRSSDPRRARELLGEPLWELLGGPSSGRRAPKARDLPRYIEALERI